MTIAYLGLEVWENIKAFVEDCEGFEYVHIAIFSALELIRASCRHKNTFSEDENWQEYRLFAGNAIQSLLLLEFRANKARAADYLKGAAHFSDLVTAENYVFTVVCVLEAVDELEEFDCRCVESSLLLVLGSAMEEPLQGTALELFKLGAEQFVRLGKNIPEIMSYCIKSLNCNEKVQKAAAEAFVEIIKAIKELIPAEVISIIITEIMKTEGKLAPEIFQIAFAGIGVAIAKSPDVLGLSLSCTQIIKLLGQNSHKFINANIGFLKGLLTNRTALPKALFRTLLDEMVSCLPGVLASNVCLSVELLCLVFSLPRDVFCVFA